MTFIHTYRIKPLAWELDDSCFPEMWVAEIPFNTLHVTRIAGKYTWFFGTGDASNECDSIEDGKAKAEAAYQERLLMFLERFR